MTFCCLCHARGIERSAKPVNIGVPLCIECQNAGAARVAAAVDAPPVALDAGTDSAAQLARYAQRLTAAGGLATMTTRGTA